MLCNHVWKVLTNPESEHVYFQCMKCGRPRNPKEDEQLTFGPVTVDAGKELLLHVAARVPLLPAMLWFPLACREMLVLQISCGGVDIFKKAAGAPVEMFCWVNTLPAILWPQIEPGPKAVTFHLIGCAWGPKPSTFSGAFYMPRRGDV